jgi:hypothetical protein
VRFYPEEEKNDPEFAKKLAAPADIYVNDAFGTAHRAHASTEGVTKFLSPSVAGFLLQKELDYLGGWLAGRGGWEVCVCMVMVMVWLGAVGVLRRCALRALKAGLERSRPESELGRSWDGCVGQVAGSLVSW